MVEESKGGGPPDAWTYAFPNAAEDSDEKTLHLVGRCTSANARGAEAIFTLLLRSEVDGSGWRGLVGGPNGLEESGTRWEAQLKPV